MDDSEDDAGYPPMPLRSSSFPSSQRNKLQRWNAPPRDNRHGHPKDEEEEEEDCGGEEFEEEEEEEEFEEDPNNMDRAMKEDEEEEEDDEEEYEEDSLERWRKRRRLDRLALGFEFAPRVAASTPPAPPPAAAVSNTSVGNSTADWSEDSTFALLDAWGDRYLQNGRNSLSSDEWMEAAKKVSQGSRTAHSEAKCRNRLDTLKKKNKKEKARMETSTNSSRMMLLPSLPAAPRQQPRLPCGFDSGEYVFMNSRVHQNQLNSSDEMSDSPRDSECEYDQEDDESDGLPPPRVKYRGGMELSSFMLLADSVQKFGEIYEKIENSKKQHMAELERMRREFHRDLEVHRRQILERAHSEISRIRRGEWEEDEVDEEVEEEELEDVNGDDEEIDVPLENARD